MKHTLRFKRLSENANAPYRAHTSDSGLDLCSVEEKELKPFQRHTFKTGIAFVIPEGFEIQLRPRSGLSSRGIVAMFGTIDQGYRGEVGVTLYNLTGEPQMIHVGDRIAQIVPASLSAFETVEIEGPLEVTDRGCDGFGSTGDKMPSYTCPVCGKVCSDSDGIRDMGVVFCSAACRKKFFAIDVKSL